MSQLIRREEEVEERKEWREKQGRRWRDGIVTRDIGVGCWRWWTERSRVRRVIRERGREGEKRGE